VTPRFLDAGLCTGYGSCRKAHADSLDCLLLLDERIGDNAISAIARPQQLFLTGDQIYADDVPDALLHMIRLGVDQLVFDDPGYVVSGEKQFDFDLPPGSRAEYTRETLGFTADAESDSNIAKSHLFTFGEYALTYILSYSSALWTGIDSLPTFADLYPGESTTFLLLFETSKFKEFSRESEGLTALRNALDRSGRALANVATYMILDDHDITDDFLLSRPWVERAMFTGRGNYVVRNGLMAYALFQDWGNRPVEYRTGQRATFLTKVQELANAGFSSIGIWNEISSLVGTQALLSETQAGELVHQTPPLRWNFDIRWDSHRAIVMDTRTRRYFPRSAERLRLPGLLSEQAIAEQMPIQPNSWVDTNGGVTLVVAPGPLVDLSFKEQNQIDNSVTESGSYDIDAEGMRFNDRIFEAFLGRIAQLENGGDTRAVVLAGDIHYGFCSKIQYWGNGGPGHPAATYRATVAQVVSSSLKNQSRPQGFFEKPKATLTLHMGGFDASRKRIDRLSWTRPPGSVRYAAGTGIDRGSGKSVVWNVPVKDGVAFSELYDDAKAFSSIQVATPPERFIRISLLGADRTFNVPPIGTPDPDENLYAAAIGAHMYNYFTGYTQLYRRGREIVGTNTIGLVSFDWGSRKAVVQDLLWWAKPYKEMYEKHSTNEHLPFKLFTKVIIPLDIEEIPNLGGTIPLSE
jgi:hypothetical protein